MPTEFRFPDCCCRCLAAAPTRHWSFDRVHTTNDADGNMVLHERWIHVPLCKSCWWRMVRTRVWSLIAAAPVGLAAAAAVIYWPLHPEPIHCLIAGVVAGLMAAVFAYGLLSAVLKTQSGAEIGSLSPDSDELHFVNQEYQRLFDKLNPRAWQPTAAYRG